jgi:hypothetical protein
MKIYNYIFHKLYQILSLFDDSPSFWVTIVMCWLFLFNSFTLKDYLLSGTSLQIEYNKAMTIAHTIAIILIHFLYFNHKRRWKIVNEQFKDETKATSVLGGVGVAIYFFLTIWLFFKVTIPFVGN